jgi:hypothetical protein
LESGRLFVEEALVQRDRKARGPRMMLIAARDGEERLE